LLIFFILVVIAIIEIATPVFSAGSSLRCSLASARQSRCGRSAEPANNAFAPYSSRGKALKNARKHGEKREFGPERHQKAKAPGCAPGAVAIVSQFSELQ
jgi:hypothetical protein